MRVSLQFGILILIGILLLAGLPAALAKTSYLFDPANPRTTDIDVNVQVAFRVTDPPRNGTPYLIVTYPSGQDVVTEATVAGEKVGGILLAYEDGQVHYRLEYRDGDTVISQSPDGIVTIAPIPYREPGDRRPWFIIAGLGMAVILILILGGAMMRPQVRSLEEITEMEKRKRR